MAARRWVLQPQAEAGRLAADLGLHPRVAAILARRGYSDAESASAFLDPSESSIESPFAFRDMQKAAQRILRAARSEERILVYGDYDVDGVTGCAVLAPALEKIGASFDVYIPHRVNEGYGLNAATLSRLLDKGYGLLVTVDNGITGDACVRLAASRGVETIIVDHHIAPDALPPAHAIVSACTGAGDASLAACGLAFKLAWALLGSFEAAKDLLDLVAMGTVADLAPVTGDNRALLKLGLPALAATKRPGLRALMTVARVSRGRLSYRDIAFGLGPRVNASGRMGSAESAFRLLTTRDEREAFELARLLDEGNRERQKAEQTAFEEAARLVEAEGLASDGVVVVGRSGWHEGILGIVASRLVERFHRPAVVIALKEGMGKGSGRSVPQFSLFDAVKECHDVLAGFGGHAQACGLTLKEESLPLFRKKLNEAASRRAAAGLETTLDIDGELVPQDLDTSFIRDLERLAPFGPGNPRPLFLTRGLAPRGEARKMGKDTLRCWLIDTAGRSTCEVVGFRMYERWKAGGSGARDIVYQPALVDFDGISSIQLELEDWRLV